MKTPTAATGSTSFVIAASSSKFPMELKGDWRIRFHSGALNCPSEHAQHRLTTSW
jgi:hypothetical protein